MTTTAQEPQPRAPASQRNWLAAIENEPSRGAQEVPFVSDARFTGMVLEGFGPYQFWNTIPVNTTPGTIAAPLILRAEAHVAWDAEINMNTIETNDESYHGRGWLYEELAALASLAIGVRIKAGSVTRVFGSRGDPRGRPQAWQLLPEPRLLEPSTGRAILPRALGTHSLDDLAPLLNYPRLSPRSAIALVRAARLYQDGLWIVESEPQLSWLLLVSAVETAANQWRAATEAPLYRLKTSLPKLEAKLAERGDSSFVTEVASMLAPYLGSTRKFMDFLIHFLPPPPDKRPTHAQHSWDDAALRKSFRMIYGYRSQALHGGKPFPAPLCMPAFASDPSGNPFEAGWSLATSTSGGTWASADLPMLLHLFEHITRGALLRWWSWMSQQ